MNNLFLIIEQHCNGYIFELLDFLSLVSILTGIFVIITKNPIISILFLICLFLSIASYLMLLGMNFIGLSYLLVYIGAVSILFLFILMLINIRISELQSDTNNSIPLAIIISVFFYCSVFQILPYNIVMLNNNNYLNNLLYNISYNGHENNRALFENLNISNQNILFV